MVYYDDLMIENGAELRISPAIDLDVRTHAIALLDVGPPFTKRRSVQGHAAADNGDEPSAGPKPQQRLLNVPRAELRAVPIDAAASCRERRIHHDCVIESIIRQEVIEPLGVKRCDGEFL